MFIIQQKIPLIKWFKAFLNILLFPLATQDLNEYLRRFTPQYDIYIYVMRALESGIIFVDQK